MPASALYLGLMSGTSQDGIDAVVADFGGRRIHVVAARAQSYPPALRRRLLSLASSPQRLTFAELCALDAAVARAFAAAATAALRAARLSPRRIAALGSHGQTVFHAPDGAAGATLQLGDPSRIAAETGITTVADFRRKDVALGGQGAPLVPAFHQWAFAAREPRCVLNVGGIANVTVLAADGSVSGFDTGPGNALMDEWAQRHLGRAYDAAGRWAASGTVHAALLAALLGDPWLARRGPKSTGRGHFNLDWARRRYPGLARVPRADVQRTLLELTARSAADAVRRAAPGTRRLLVCGGGARNTALMRRLSDLLAPAPVEPTDAFGVDARHVEALAFAWLAKRALEGKPGNVPAVTGARRPAVLGGIYPA